MKHVLIVGCGDVGTALGARLHHDGYKVSGLRRNTSGLPSFIQGVCADLRQPISFDLFPDDVDVVVYMPSAGEFSDAAYRQIYVDGVDRVHRALGAKQAQLARVIYVSSTAVYGQRAGEWVDESTETVPRGFSGERLLEGEAAARGMAECAVIVRFGGIYGPERRRLIERVRHGASCVESPPIYTNRIHRDDCAGFLAHLVSHPAPEPLYLGVDDAPVGQCVVMDWLAKQLGVDGPARIEEPIASGATGRRGSNKRCRNDRLHGSGYELLYPTFREGYASVLNNDCGLAV